MAIDTLQLSKDLQKDFPANQAEAIAKALAQQSSNDLALPDIEKLRFDLLALATKRDLELGIREVRIEIKEGPASLKVDLIKWIVGALAINIFGTAGLVVTLIKLVPR